MPAVPTGQVALRVAQVVRLTGATPRLIRDLVARGELRARHVGRHLYVDPASVRAVFGFDPEPGDERDPELERFVAQILETS